MRPQRSCYLAPSILRFYERKPATVFVTAGSRTDRTPLLKASKTVATAEQVIEMTNGGARPSLIARSGSTSLAMELRCGGLQRLGNILIRGQKLQVWCREPLQKPEGNIQWGLRIFREVFHTT